MIPQKVAFDVFGNVVGGLLAGDDQRDAEQGRDKADGKSTEEIAAAKHHPQGAADEHKDQATESKAGPAVKFAENGVIDHHALAAKKIRGDGIERAVGEIGAGGMRLA